MKKEKKKISSKTLTIAIFVGLVLGVVFGLIMPAGAVPVVGLVSGIYMNALRMMIYPLVFCSLIVGIKGIGSVGATGKVGLQSVLYFTGTTLFASALGLILPKAFSAIMPKTMGVGFQFQMQEADVAATEFISILDTVKNLIPSNPVASFVNGDMLQVLVFAIIVGVACVALKEKAEPFVKVAEAINEICVKVISVVMYFTPIGVFTSIATVIYSNGAAAIISLGKLLLVLYAVTILYILIVYGSIVKFIGKVPVKTFFTTVMPAALNAFGTCSSSATIPISKKCADDLGVPNEISSLAIPLGATVNMDAVSILMSFMIVFFANACGVDISFGMLAIVVLANTLLSIGTPGVPGGAIASFAALATIAGLPMGIMTLYISVNTLCDMIATCCNVLGDIACSVAMKETCKLDK